jgi:predicted Zn-dependent protease
MRVKLFSVLLLVFLTSSIFSQESFTHPEAYITVTLPAGWMYEADETTLTATTEDESLAFTFSVLETDDMDAALDAIDEMLAADFEEISLGEAEEVDFNGLYGIIIEGTADGLECAFAIIDSPVEGISMLMSGWAAPEVLEAYGEDIGMILNSISPAE